MSSGLTLGLGEPPPQGKKEENRPGMFSLSLLILAGRQGCAFSVAL
jgi:hypothetical protein